MQPSKDLDQKLAAWRSACRDRPLDAYDDRYVEFDTEGLRGDDRKALLSDAIELADLEGEDTTCQLFSGYRGSGKSTELRRLRKRLEDDGHLVLAADASDYHSLTRDLTISELLPIIVGAFAEHAADALGKEVLGGGWWERLTTFLSSEVSLSPSFALGPVQVRAALRRDEVFTSQLRDALKGTGKLHVLAEVAHGFVGDTVAALRRKHPEARGVVFLFDNLEKLSGPEETFRQRMRSVVEVFADHHGTMRLPGCHTVYTVPLYLEFLYPRLSEHYDAPLQVLPTIKVTGRAPGRTPFAPGIRRLKDLLAARVPLDEAFASEAHVERLVLASAGHLRSLLDLMADALLRSRRVGLPIHEAVLDTTIARFGEKRRVAVRRDGVPMLETIRQSNALERLEEGDLPRLAHYLDSHIVLCYRNGGGWYDVHPSIRELIAELASEREDEG